MTDWRPIETAPKDGKVIVCTHPSKTIEYRPRAAFWYVARGTGAEGWKSVSNHAWLNPTHWMPLPAPPTDSARLSGGRDD